MTKLKMILAASAALTGSVAFAGGHTAQERAEAMSGALKMNKGDASIARELRPGGALESVGTGGWGNIGSALTTATGKPVAPSNPKNVDLSESE